jgi:hypothetical protein
VPSFRIGLLAAALAFGIMLMPTSGFAQADQHRARGNDACTPDAQRLCKKFFGQGDGSILQCFQSNRTRLSGPCRKFLGDLGLLS